MVSVASDIDVAQRLLVVVREGGLLHGSNDADPCGANPLLGADALDFLHQVTAGLEPSHQRAAGLSLPESCCHSFARASYSKCLRLSVIDVRAAARAG